MKFVLFALSILVSSLSYWLTRDILTPQQATVFGIFVLAVILWVLEVIPLFVTGLLTSSLLILFAGLKSQLIFASYFDPVIVLFFGGFVLARGLQKYGLDHLFVSLMLKHVGAKPRRFLLALMGITAFLSLWMSNSAAAAMMIPIAILTVSHNRLRETHDPFAKSLILGVAYAASIGGMGMIVGSPPNAIAAKHLSASGISFTFVDWLLYAGPFSILALLLTWLILIVVLPPRLKTLTLSPPETVGLSWRQAAVMVIFFITAVGWVVGESFSVSSAVVALFPVVSLFSLGLLEESDLGRISWSTLLLFGGGIALGLAVSQVGLDTWFVTLLKDDLVSLPKFGLILGLTFFGIAVTMVASNTASAAILIPLFLPLAEPLGLSAQSMAVLLALGVSLDFMMPVGTPPNAIAYSTGYFKVKEMMRYGFLVNIGTGLLLATLFYFMS